LNVKNFRFVLLSCAYHLVRSWQPRRRYQKWTAPADTTTVIDVLWFCRLYYYTAASLNRENALYRNRRKCLLFICLWTEPVGTYYISYRHFVRIYRSFGHHGERSSPGVCHHPMPPLLQHCEPDDRDQAPPYMFAHQL